MSDDVRCLHMADAMLKLMHEEFDRDQQCSIVATLLANWIDGMRTADGRKLKSKQAKGLLDAISADAYIAYTTQSRMRDALELPNS